MLKFVEIYIEHRQLKLNQAYTYLAPISALVGMRVEVQFKNQVCIGFIVKCEDFSETKLQTFSDQDIEIKEVLRVIDTEAVLTQELIDLGFWMANETISPVISCFQVMLPKVKRISSSYQDAQLERWVHLVKKPEKCSKYQLELVEELSVDCLMTQIKGSKSTLKTMIKNGYIEVYTKEKTYQDQTYKQKLPDYELSDKQKNALDIIHKSDKDVMCLFGKTGSGKTELYLKLAEEALKLGKQSLICVPEIALTEQMVRRVQERFGQDVVVYHSHLSDHERYLQYKRVSQNDVSLVVGTRSSIFLPFKDLAWIILDEEHDSSYKQEALPYYHTRDIAIKRASYFKAKVLLGSATPSFETYARALKNVYQLVELDERVKGIMPEIKLVHNPRHRRTILAQETIDFIQNKVSKNEQIILLLNRRGFAPVFQCVECSKAIECKACDRLMVYHKEDNLLKCHSCGLSHPIPQACPSCGSHQLRMMGYGTQRLEEEIISRIEGIRILRMDKDSTSKKKGHQIILDAFNNHEADILLGTQMIAKGLDNPLVSGSIILDIDRSLLRTDYRSIEDAFSLILQTAGRSGRSSLKSEVLIQSDLHDHYVFHSVFKHDYPRFFMQEMQYRKLGQNPPYTFLITITLFGSNQEVLSRNARKLYEALAHDTIKCLGPSDMGKVNYSYKNRIILKGRDLNEMRHFLKQTLDETVMVHKWDCLIDVNPMGIL
jgi:primosomal protein N' (replication factor Y) (superfamily II helicase)